ncbi:MAG: substrate-binding domain-containing protein [Campylobacterota bacterium]|nr:substrate-binding domain-containing protein [Campylobacterota bacterium]
MKKIALASLLLVASISLEAREQLKIVGSSTVYPFSSSVAEELGSVSKYPTPVVESTGTGGGMKLFCAGADENSPDITNASRRMTLKEFYTCDRNGVSDITEVMFGYDGIVLAQSIENEKLNITKHEILLAVAAKVPSKDGNSIIKNPYTSWNQINPELPNKKITIYGPPKSSGTRDAFEEMVLEYQTNEIKAYRDAGLKGYRVVRTDGVYVPSGENDNLIVTKLTKDKGAVGIFGYSFLMENDDMVSAVTIDNIEPTPETIASNAYPISRSLYFYVKNSHNYIKSQAAYIDLFISEDMIGGEEAILAEIGLISLPLDTLEKVQSHVSSRVKLEESDLKSH